MNMYFYLVNAAIIISIVGVVFALFQKCVRNSKKWAATVTPLASIIGSGFLVVAPLLNFHFGVYSPLAIIVLVLLAYWIGSVIRENILADVKDPQKDLLKKLSHIILFLAYVVSVAFYIELLASFLVRGLGTFASQFDYIKPLVSTSILLFIGVRSYLKSLKGLEKMEEVAVNGKLAIIAGLIVGLCFYNFKFIGDWHPLKESSIGLNSIRVLMGSIIVVQGFETSRFLVSHYSPKIVVTTMRYSQILSGLIYIVFVSLMVIVFTEDIQVSDTAIIDLSSKVSFILPTILIVAAVLSQFSAATADTIGAGGLLEGLTNKISTKAIYLPVILGSISLVWLTNVFEIVAIASRCFAIYYMVECLAAAKRCSKTSKLRMTSHLILAAILFMCAIFGLPAEA